MFKLLSLTEAFRVKVKTMGFGFRPTWVHILPNSTAILDGLPDWSVSHFSDL